VGGYREHRQIDRKADRFTGEPVPLYISIALLKLLPSMYSDITSSASDALASGVKKVRALRAKRFFGEYLREKYLLMIPSSGYLSVFFALSFCVNNEHSEFKSSIGNTFHKLLNTQFLAGLKRKVRCRF
jgi:hypothetical protein